MIYCGLYMWLVDIFRLLEILIYCQKKKIDEPTAPAKKTATTNSGYRSKEDRAKETKKRVRVSEIEKEISRLEEENNKLLEEISTPGVASNFPLLEEKCKKMDEIKRKIDSLYEEYESYLWKKRITPSVSYILQAGGKQYEDC